MTESDLPELPVELLIQLNKFEELNIDAQSDPSYRRLCIEVQTLGLMSAIAGNPNVLLNQQYFLQRPTVLSRNDPSRMQQETFEYVGVGKYWGSGLTIYKDRGSESDSPMEVTQDIFNISTWNCFSGEVCSLKTIPGVNPLEDSIYRTIVTFGRVNPIDPKLGPCIRYPFEMVRHLPSEENFNGVIFRDNSNAGSVLGIACGNVIYPGKLGYNNTLALMESYINWQQYRTSILFLLARNCSKNEEAFHTLKLFTSLPAKPNQEDVCLFFSDILRFKKTLPLVRGSELIDFYRFLRVTFSDVGLVGSIPMYFDETAGRDNSVITDCLVRFELEYGSLFGNRLDASQN